MDGGKNFDPQKGQLENSNGRINVPSCFLGAEMVQKLAPNCSELWHDFIFVYFRLSASNETLWQGAGKTTCIAPMLTLLLLGRNTPVLLRHGGNIAVGFGILLKLEVVTMLQG